MKFVTVKVKVTFSIVYFLFWFYYLTRFYELNTNPVNDWEPGYYEYLADLDKVNTIFFILSALMVLAAFAFGYGVKLSKKKKNKR